MQRRPQQQRAAEVDLGWHPDPSLPRAHGQATAPHATRRRARASPSTRATHGTRIGASCSTVTSVRDARVPGDRVSGVSGSSSHAVTAWRSCAARLTLAPPVAAGVSRRGRLAFAPRRADRRRERVGAHDGAGVRGVDHLAGAHDDPDVRHVAGARRRRTRGRRARAARRPAGAGRRRTVPARCAAG